MALAIESIGQLILNISLFGTGMAFGILGLILAVTRSMSKDKNKWALTFSAFSWAIALIIPNVWYSGLIFGMGAFALTFSFMPIIEKAGDSNIFIIAIIAVIMNLLLLTGSGAYQLSLGWQTNMQESMSDITALTTGNIAKVGTAIPEMKLCQPNEEDENGEPCQSDIVSGSFDENLFVPFASVLTIGTYIGKAVAFIGMVLLAPLAMGQTLSSQAYFKNIIILNLMLLTVMIWEIAIFYKTIAFILGKRGMK